MSLETMWIRFAPRLRLILTICISGWLLYFVDFYLLPTLTKQDRIVSAGEVGVMNRGRWVSGGAHFHTERGLSFGTDKNYLEFVGRTLQVSYSPIFKSVKAAVISDQKYQPLLVSDLNGISKYFHLLTLLVLIGGRLMLRGKNAQDEELIMNIAVSTLFFLLLSGLVFFYWH